MRRLFLFTSIAAGTVFAIGNEDNAVSGSIGYFVLKGVKFIKLGSVEICGFSGLKQKIISLYNVYILYQSISYIDNKVLCKPLLKNFFQNFLKSIAFFKNFLSSDVPENRINTQHIGHIRRVKPQVKKVLNFLKKKLDKGDVLWYYNQALSRGGRKTDLEN